MTKPRRTATQSGLTANTVRERQSSRIATYCLIAIYIIGLATENGIQESSAGKSSPNWVSQAYPDTFLKRCSLLWIKQEVWCYKTRTTIIHGTPRSPRSNPVDYSFILKSDVHGKSLISYFLVKLSKGINMSFWWKRITHIYFTRHCYTIRLQNYQGWNQIQECAGFESFNTLPLWWRVGILLSTRHPLSLMTIYDKVRGMYVASLQCSVANAQKQKPFLSSANGFQSFCPSLQHLKEKSQLRRILFYFSWNRQHLISKCIRLSRYWFMKIVILIVPAELLNAVKKVKKELIVTRKWTLEHLIQHVNFS